MAASLVQFHIQEESATRMLVKQIVLGASSQTGVIGANAALVAATAAREGLQAAVASALVTLLETRSAPGIRAPMCNLQRGTNVRIRLHAQRAATSSASASRRVVSMQGNRSCTNPLASAWLLARVNREVPRPT